MPRDDPPPTPRLRRTGPASRARPEMAAPEKSLRHRHEAFCQHFVLLGNATDAAARAGYASEWARNQGYRLMRQPRIQARVAEIRSGLARAYCLDAGVLLGKLEAVYQRAIGNLDFHAAARCVEIQARIAGHVPTRGVTRGAEVRRTDREPTRGADGRSPDREKTRGEEGRRPDRDTMKTIDDDPTPGAAGNCSKSKGSGITGG